MHEGVDSDASRGARRAYEHQQEGYEVEDRPEQLKVVDELVTELVKRVARWASTVVNPQVLVLRNPDRVSYPFEDANKERLKRIDELILRSCQELGSSKVKDPLFSFARALSQKLFDETNIAAELVSVRATRSAQLMQDYRLGKNKSVAATELRARGLMGKRAR